MVVVVIVVLITFAERGARKVDMPRVPASDTKSLTGRERGWRERGKLNTCAMSPDPLRLMR